jgi:hypothetical protein
LEITLAFCDSMVIEEESFSGGEEAGHFSAMQEMSLWCKD